MLKANIKLKSLIRGLSKNKYIKSNRWKSKGFVIINYSEYLLLLKSGIFIGNRKHWDLLRFTLFYTPLFLFYKTQNNDRKSNQNSNKKQNNNREHDHY